jgi:hypothetical protein
MAGGVAGQGEPDRRAVIVVAGSRAWLLRRNTGRPHRLDLDAAEAVGGSGAVDVLEVAGLLGSLVDKAWWWPSLPG